MIWELGTRDLLLSFSLICCTAYICGWITDRILGSAGFGVIGNWLLMLIGGYVGLYCYNMIGYRLFTDPARTVAVIFASAVVMLFFMLSAKAVLKV